MLRGFLQLTSQVTRTRWSGRRVKTMSCHKELEVGYPSVFEIQQVAYEHEVKIEERDENLKHAS